jgi:hypothetical protein
MKPVFLDTGYLIALEAGDDRTMQRHEGTGASFHAGYRRL